jgi:hypothetical protein
MTALNLAARDAGSSEQVNEEWGQDGACPEQRRRAPVPAIVAAMKTIVLRQTGNSPNQKATRHVD